MIDSPRLPYRVHTKTGRKHSRVTTYLKPDPENMDLHEKDAKLFNSILLKYSEIHPELREVR